MDASHLHESYNQLRHQLDAAYAAPVWDSRQIDHIADQMIPIEAALASAHAQLPGAGHDGA